MSRNIGIASVVWATGILLSRLVGLAREVVIGRTLGASGEADLYFAAFILPDWLNYLLAGGVLSIVFIPIFQSYLTREDEAGAWRAFSVVGSFATLLMLVATAALWVATPWLVETVVAPGKSAADHAQLVGLVHIILPAQIFHVLGGLLSATLQARDRHVLPAAAAVVYPACIVAGGLLGGDAEGFCWGVLVGSAAGPFGLPLIGNLLLGLHARPSFELRHPDFRLWFWRMLPVMLGASVVALDDLVVKAYASFLEEGAVGRLTYARTLMKVPMGVFGLAAGMAAYPTITRIIAEGRPVDAYQTLARAARAVLVLAFAAQAGLTVAASDVVTVIWGFDAAVAQEVGLYCAVLCVGLWAWSAQLLVVRGFYAQGNTWLPTLLGTVVLALAFPLYGWLSREHGAVGLAVSSSVAISAYVAVLAWQVRRTLGVPREVPGIGWTTIRLAASAAAGVGVGRWVEGFVASWPALPRGFVAGGVAALLTLAVARLLRVEEVALVTARLRRRS